MMLEAQFGSNIAPIERPKLPETRTTNGTTTSKSDLDEDALKEEAEQERMDLEAREDAELHRLHSLGIPVPGIEIRVDNHVARVWLETLEVECSYGVLRDRVRAVVERAVETVADLWRVEDVSGKMKEKEKQKEGVKEEKVEA